MSFNTIFKTYEELITYLNDTDQPQCFTVNYLPDSDVYELWIGNQPYYVYEKWIDELDSKINELQKENNKLTEALDIVESEYWKR